MRYKEFREMKKFDRIEYLLTKLQLREIDPSGFSFKLTYDFIVLSLLLLPSIILLTLISKNPGLMIAYNRLLITFCCVLIGFFIIDIILMFRWKKRYKGIDDEFRDRS